MNLAPVLRVPVAPSGVVKSACTVWSVEPCLPSVVRSVRSKPARPEAVKVFTFRVVVGAPENWYERMKLRPGTSLQRCW